MRTQLKRESAHTCSPSGDHHSRVAALVMDEASPEALPAATAALLLLKNARAKAASPSAAPDNAVVALLDATFSNKSVSMTCAADCTKRGKRAASFDTGHIAAQS